jgi:adenylate cyclase
MTGQVITGSVGDQNRLEYTVLGDTVNTAARLESYDKTDPDDTDYRILIGENTLSQLDNLFSTEYVGKVVLKGKSEKTYIYRLISSIDER